MFRSRLFQALGFAMLAAIVMLRAQSAAAMEFVPTTLPSGILARGMIMPGDAARFNRAIAKAKGTKLLMLYSPGGYVDDAIALGRAIRAAHFKTYAGACASACVYAFAGGVERRARPGALLVHGVTLDLAVLPRSALDQSLLALERYQLEDYLTEMGVSPALLVRAESVPQGEPLEPVTEPDALRFHLITAAEPKRPQQKIVRFSSGYVDGVARIKEKGIDAVEQLPYHLNAGPRGIP